MAPGGDDTSRGDAVWEGRIEIAGLQRKRREEDRLGRDKNEREMPFIDLVSRPGDVAESYTLAMVVVQCRALLGIASKLHDVSLSVQEPWPGQSMRRL